MPRLSREERERLDRLAGSGEGWGGGLPLPRLFSAILNEVLDNGSAAPERMTTIASSVLEFKTNQVMSTWKDWEDFTADVLAQMEAKNILRLDGGEWTAGEALVTGTNIEVIPATTWKGRKYPSDGVTVWEKEERAARSRADHSKREAMSLVGNFRPAEPTHVSEIRQSEAQVGQLYPVLVDQHGRILDGGHRKAANPSWREHKIKVDSEEMALAIGLWANRGKPLPPKVQARVTELIGDLAGTNQIKRDRIKAALLADPSRSARDIAREVGCDHKTAGDVKRELENSGEIPHYSSTGGNVSGAPRSTPGRTTGTQVQYDKEGLRREIERLRRADLPVDREAMMARFGCGEGTVQSMRSQVDAVLAAEREAEAALASEPLPVEADEPHAHDWGPWVRECAECGEMEEKDS